MSRLPLTPLSTLKVSQYQIPRHNYTPNTSIQGHPLLIYHSCIPASTSPSDIEAHLTVIGVVTPTWRYTMYDRSHFHSSTHEVLCVFRGSAELCFGGETNPSKIECVVSAGDVMIIPAGVAHRLLQDFAGNFEMVGSYPVGKICDMCYGVREEEEKVGKIEGLGWFERDPLYGDEGPVLYGGEVGDGEQMVERKD